MIGGCLAISLLKEMSSVRDDFSGELSVCFYLARFLDDVYL